MTLLRACFFLMTGLALIGCVGTDGLATERAAASGEDRQPLPDIRMQCPGWGLTLPPSSRRRAQRAQDAVIEHRVVPGGMGVYVLNQHDADDWYQAVAGAFFGVDPSTVPIDPAVLSNTANPSDLAFLMEHPEPSQAIHPQDVAPGDLIFGYELDEPVDLSPLSGPADLLASTYPGAQTLWTVLKSGAQFLPRDGSSPPPLRFAIHFVLGSTTRGLSETQQSVVTNLDVLTYRYHQDLHTGWATRETIAISVSRYGDLLGMVSGNQVLNAARRAPIAVLEESGICDECTELDFCSPQWRDCAQAAGLASGPSGAFGDTNPLSTYVTGTSCVAYCYDRTRYGTCESRYDCLRAMGEDVDRQSESEICYNLDHVDDCVNGPDGNGCGDPPDDNCTEDDPDYPDCRDDEPGSSGGSNQGSTGWGLSPPPMHFGVPQGVSGGCYIQQYVCTGVPAGTAKEDIDVDDPDNECREDGRRACPNEN